MQHTKLLRFGQLHVVPLHGMEKLESYLDFFCIILADNIVGGDDGSEVGKTGSDKAKKRCQGNCCGKKIFTVHRGSLVR